MGFGQGLLAHSPEPPHEQTHHPPAPAQTTGVAKAEAAANEQTDNFHGEQREEVEEEVLAVVRVRFHIIRNACIENIGKSESCMVSKLRIIWKQTVAGEFSEEDEEEMGNLAR